MIDLIHVFPIRSFFLNLLKAGPETTVFYSNHKRNNYSEWGLIALSLGREVQGLHVLPQSMPQETSWLLLVPNEEELANLALAHQRPKAKTR